MNGLEIRMKSSRFNTQYRNNASNLHKAIGEVLHEEGGAFSFYKIYQEYPVQKIDEEYPYASHKLDWVVLDLKLVIECHGKQHYEPSGFGEKNPHKVIDSFLDQKHRDKLKMEAVIKKGFTYLEIPYTVIGKVTSEYLYSLFLEHKNEEPTNQSSKVRRKGTQYYDKYQTFLRKKRKKDYQKFKEWKSKCNRGD